VAIWYGGSYRPLYPTKRWIPSAPAHFSVTASTGTYLLSGQDVSLRYFHLNADVGSYTIVGASATLAFDLNAISGVYNLTGTAVTFPKVIAVASGVYTLTGTAASLLATRLLSADSGAYTYTGKAASLFSTYSSGAYILSGTDATLIFTPVGGGPTTHLLPMMGIGG
jgi:hypothetical protein